MARASRSRTHEVLSSPLEKRSIDTGDELQARGHARTGIAAADFWRIRNADLGRFTTDRLMSILNRLGTRVEVKVRVRRAERVEAAVPV